VNLGYTVYSRVYTPYGYDNLNNLPVIYVTDGHEYSDQRMGSMITVLDNLINEGKIKPIIAVFIDPRLNLSNSNNLRGDQYTINKKFADFVADELVPFIDLNYKTNKSAGARSILGTSLGGLNSAYFGIYRADKFHLIGIHSPAFQAKTQIYDMYNSSEKLPLKIFMSTGTINDTQNNALQLKSILDSKGYQLQYIEVPEGHSWGNWRALIDNCLIYFFKENIPLKVGDVSSIPQEFVQIHNYPNPFNPQTTIIYSIPRESKITISVFNLLGQKVTDLVDEVKTSGSYNVNWNASSYASGVFFYRITATPTNGEHAFMKTNKMVLLR
jgi:enterochelin esterase family protein